MNQWGQPPVHRNYPPEPEKGFFDSNQPQIIAIALAAVAAIGFVVYKTTRGPAVAVQEVDKDKGKPKEKAPVVVEEPPKEKPPQKAPPPTDPVVAQTDEPDTVDWTAAPDSPAEDAPLETVSFALAGAISPGVSAKYIGIAPGNKHVALAGDDSVEIWDLEKKQRTAQLKLGVERVAAVALPSPEKALVWLRRGGLVWYAGSSGDTTPLAIPAHADQGADYDAGLAVSPMGRYFALSRKGTRIYRADDATLCGVIPTPEGQHVLALGFHPKGKELYVVYQSQESPRRFRAAIYDLGTGQETKESHKPRPGNLAAPQIHGPLGVVVDEQNRLYLFLSGRAILNGEDGRLLTLVEDPPEFAVPLDQGRFWTGDGRSSPKVVEIEWGRLQKLRRNFDSNKGAASQVHPEQAVSVKIEVGKVSGDKGAITAMLEAAVKDRLAAEGIAVKAGSESRLEIHYNEHEEKLTSIKVKSSGRKPDVRPGDGSAAIPEIEIRWMNDQVDRKQLWTRKFKVRAADVVCTPEQAQKPPAQAFAAAARDQAVELLSGYPIPYYISQAVVGGNEILPVQSSKLK